METLGKYEIREELGRGGFGAVYRALDTTLKREVALKVLNPALLHEAGWLARFRREAQVIAALEHPRIVTVYEIAEADNRAFIAMKLLRGPSLDQLLKTGGPLPWEEARRIVLEVAEALTYAHGQGVLHRDLKPANIVLDAATGAVLTDFGFARLMGDTSLSLSASGGLVGTPHYIAPELWQNQPPSPASDLYALGCILYEMVLGRKAFPGDTSPAVMMAHFQPLTLPEAWPDGTPPGLADVLRRALAQEPAERFPTIAALTEAVAALQVDPWAVPYAELEAAIAAQAWSEALALAESLHAQAPDYRAVARLLEQAKAELARADLIAQWRAQAEAALAAGQLQAARAAAEQWLRLAPEDNAAQMMQRRIETQLATDAKSQKASVQMQPVHIPDLARPPTTDMGSVQESLASPVPSKQISKRKKLPVALGIAGGSVLALVCIGLVMLFIWNGLFLDGNASTPMTNIPAPTRTPQPTATLAATRTPQPTATPAASAHTAISLQDTHKIVIQHDETWGIQSCYCANTLNIKDFIAEANFYNPYSSARGDWDYGFFFRESVNTDNTLNKYAVWVESNGRWVHGVIIDGKWQANLAQGYLSLRSGANQSNHLKLIVTGATGQFWVNGDFIAELDLSDLPNGRGVDPATGFVNGHKIHGEYTRIEQFNIWSINTP